MVRFRLYGLIFGAAIAAAAVCATHFASNLNANQFAAFHAPPATWQSAPHASSQSQQIQSSHPPFSGRNATLHTIQTNKVAKNYEKAANSAQGIKAEAK